MITQTQTLVQMAYDRGLRTRDLIKTDKGIAMLKAIVEEEGALGVGYMDAIMDKISSSMPRATLRLWALSLQIRPMSWCKP